MIWKFRFHNKKPSGTSRLRSRLTQCCPRLMVQHQVQREHMQFLPSRARTSPWILFCNLKEKFSYSPSEFSGGKDFCRSEFQNNGCLMCSLLLCGRKMRCLWASRTWKKQGVEKVKHFWYSTESFITKEPPALALGEQSVSFLNKQSGATRCFGLLGSFC